MAIQISRFPPSIAPISLTEPASVGGLGQAPVSMSDAAIQGLAAGTTSAQDAVKSFGDFLDEAIGQVTQTQHEAADAAQRLASGEVRDMAEVLLSSEKASLSLQLVIQVRNKIVEAYQEVMRMQF